MSNSRKASPPRRPRTVVAASALAASALFTTYLGALRATGHYAQATGSITGTSAVAHSVPAGCAPGSTVVDDTVSLAAALAVGDDTVLCVVESFTLDDTIVLDDTSLTLMGPDDTAVVLTSRPDARHIVATSSAGSDDTLAIYNLTLVGQLQSGSGGISFDGDFGANDADRVIIDDSASIMYSFGTSGGALDADANVYIGDAYFFANFGISGGALSTQGNLTIDGARFTYNSAFGGGAILNRDGVVTVENTQFTSNAALAGGAIVVSRSRLTVDQSVFAENQALQDGGAISAYEVVDSLVINSTTFSQNTADDSGGAIYFFSASGSDLLSLYRTWFDDNYAHESGAVHSRGRLQIQNSLFSGNDASIRAGAIGDDSGVLLMEAATFINNGDDTAPVVGGGLVSSPVGYAYMVNVTASGNRAVSQGGFAYLRGGTADRPDEVFFSTVTGNSLTSGAGAGIASSASAVTAIANSVVQGNVDGAGPYDLSLPAPGSSLSYSFVTSADSIDPLTLGSGIGVVFGDNPRLASPADNGGLRVGADRASTFMPTRMPQPGSPLIDGAQAVSESAQAFSDAVGTRRSTTGPNAIGAIQVAAPPPPTPIPAGPPLEVRAAAGDRTVTVTWQAPAVSGSFPVTQYQAVVEGSTAQCLAPATDDPTQTCAIDGLVNGEVYRVRVRALTGAGWGTWSNFSDPVTPERTQTIVITGSRVGREVRVDGETTGLVGEQVTPWIRFPGPGGYAPGTGVRTVSAEGTFTWQRVSGRKIYVYFRADDGVRSNRVIIAAP